MTEILEAVFRGGCGTRREKRGGMGVRLGTDDECGMGRIDWGWGGRLMGTDGGEGGLGG